MPHIPAAAHRLTQPYLPEVRVMSFFCATVLIFTQLWPGKADAQVRKWHSAVWRTRRLAMQGWLVQIFPLETTFSASDSKHILHMPIVRHILILISYLLQSLAFLLSIFNSSLCLFMVFYLSWAAEEQKMGDKFYSHICVFERVVH